MCAFTISFKCHEIQGLSSNNAVMHRTGSLKEATVLEFKLLQALIYRSIMYRVRNLKFATSKTLVNSVMKMMLCLTLCIFNFKKLNLLYLQQILPQFIILLVFRHVMNFRDVSNFFN